PRWRARARAARAPAPGATSRCRSGRSSPRRSPCKRGPRPRAPRPPPGAARRVRQARARSPRRSRRAPPRAPAARRRRCRHDGTHRTPPPCAASHAGGACGTCCARSPAATRARSSRGIRRSTGSPGAARPAPHPVRRGRHAGAGGRRGRPRRGGRGSPARSVTVPPASTRAARSGRCVRARSWIWPFLVWTPPRARLFPGKWAGNNNVHLRVEWASTGCEPQTGGTPMLVQRPTVDHVSSPRRAAMLLALALFVSTSARAMHKAPASGTVADTVFVTLTEWKVEVSPAKVPAGAVVFAIRNDGKIPHGFEIEGGGIEKSVPSIPRGGTGTLRATLAGGRYEAYCPVGRGSHKMLGMVASLEVQGGRGAAHATAHAMAHDDDDDDAPARAPSAVQLTGGGSVIQILPGPF